MTIRIPGNWKKGFAYDIHTLDSVYLGVDEYGHDRWENTRSEMGELLYDLKYHGRSENVEKIVDMLNRYKGIEEMDAIIPVPSTNKNRRIQPVLEIAKELGRRVGVPVTEDLLFKRSGVPVFTLTSITTGKGADLFVIDYPMRRQAVSPYRYQDPVQCHPNCFPIPPGSHPC